MKQPKYTKESLAALIPKCQSITEVIRMVGLIPSGGNHTSITTKIRNWELDISHFNGSSWSKGLTAQTSNIIAEQVKKNTVPDEEIFIENCRPINGPSLRKRMIRLGWKYECDCCGIYSWQDKPITLHIDHKNGVHNDNRFENIRFLCPNCHQQTETWGNSYKKIPVVRRVSSERTWVKKEPVVRRKKSDPRPEIRRFDPSREELFKLVWDMPSIQVAKIFGISDQAINKRCKVLNIPKPPRGYWAKKQFGKL